MTIDQSAEPSRLRSMARDLLALSTNSQTWVGREALAIAAGFADVLIGSLNLDFVFVRLCDPTAGDVIELTRTNSEQPFSESLRTQIGKSVTLSRTEILSQGGGAEPYGAIAIPIGVNSEGGLRVSIVERHRSCPDVNEAQGRVPDENRVFVPPHELVDQVST